MNSSPAISWYGKLPSAGDFLQRRFPEALTGQLFSLLSDAAGGARSGRHGLCPPMFE